MGDIAVTAAVVVLFCNILSGNKDETTLLLILRLFNILSMEISCDNNGIDIEVKDGNEGKKKSYLVEVVSLLEYYYCYGSEFVVDFEFVVEFEFGFEFGSHSGSDYYHFHFVLFLLFIILTFILLLI